MKQVVVLFALTVSLRAQTVPFNVAISSPQALDSYAMQAVSVGYVGAYSDGMMPGGGNSSFFELASITNLDMVLPTQRLTFDVSDVTRPVTIGVYLYDARYQFLFYGYKETYFSMNGDMLGFGDKKVQLKRTGNTPIYVGEDVYHFQVTFRDSSGAVTNYSYLDVYDGYVYFPDVWAGTPNAEVIIYSYNGYTGYHLDQGGAPLDVVAGTDILSATVRGLTVIDNKQLYAFPVTTNGWGTKPILLKTVTNPTTCKVLGLTSEGETASGAWIRCLEATDGNWTYLDLMSGVPESVTLGVGTYHVIFEWPDMRDEHEEYLKTFQPVQTDDGGKG